VPDPTSPVVGLIDPASTGRALGSVVEAFSTDPLLRWVWPDDDRYGQCAAGFFGLLLSLRSAGGEVWVADGGAAVARWDPPGGQHGQPAEDPWPAVNATYTQTERVRWETFNERLAVPSDAPAHWYLGVLATDPRHQRRGLGGAVLGPVLAAADGSSTPAYLETASEKNLAFYGRLGFDVEREVDLPEGGPRCWLMRRPPREAG
jgi:GNAT superfamily N-acetyltransferase